MNRTNTNFKENKNDFIIIYNVKGFIKNRHTHARLTIVVRTLSDIMHSLAPEANLNHHNSLSHLNSDPNRNLIRTRTLKQAIEIVRTSKTVLVSIGPHNYR